MKGILLFILLIAIDNSLFRQSRILNSENPNDSLKQELKATRDDSLKAWIFLHLAENNLYIQTDSALYYGEMALKLAQKVNNPEVQIGAMGFMGNALMFKGNLPKALELSFQTMELNKNVWHAGGGIGPTYDNIGFVYYYIGEYNKAMPYFKKMIQSGQKDIAGVAYGYRNMAMIYAAQNKLDSAMINLDKAYQVFKNINYSIYPYVYNFYPAWYNLRAKVYIKQNRYNLALNDLDSALKISLRNNQAFHSSNTYNIISGYYKSIDQSDSSIFYAEKGLAEANKISYTQGILDACQILAGEYETTDPVNALHYYKLADETRQNLYGEGNLQVMKDMIEQNENRQREIQEAKTAYRNKLKLYLVLTGTTALLLISLILFRSYRKSEVANAKLKGTLAHLKDTQAQLIQAEKMASLGELTAGIAHEIQNPLNFVNNFSEVNAELIDELIAERSKLKAERDESVEKEILHDIKENEQKINQHGKRADTIVKGMLQHSRIRSGVKEPTDINALADEYLRLSYHGFRAKDNSFNAEFKTDLDETLPKIHVIQQDIGRVFLNLINNAFYAVSEASAKETARADYEPEVIVTTRMHDKSIEISVKDNGDGIPEDIKEKIFQPFFTTKPTGSGTGLGLSLSYDIVKAHGGKIFVESSENKGTEFIIEIPAN